MGNDNESASELTALRVSLVDDLVGGMVALRELPADKANDEESYYRNHRKDTS